MDYEKKYKEALERAKKLASDLPNGREDRLYHISDLEAIFPELKDKDERIINCIGMCLTDADEQRFKDYDTTLKDCLAWLEKQGETSPVLSNSLNIGKDAWSEEEQNRFAKGVLTRCALSFIDYLDAHKYEGKMCVSNGECEDIENAFHNAMWDRLHRYYCKYIENQGEQKPAWSEEDKDFMYDTLSNLTELKNRYGEGYGNVGKCIDWLKSLRKRIE